MKWNEGQFDLLSHYFADISKILFASVVLGFLVPIGVGPITLPIFFIGSGVAIVCLVLSIHLRK